MTISVDWGNKIVNIPKADTILVDIGPPEIRSLNLDNFRLTVKALEADENGIVFEDIHQHFTEIVLQGDTYARVIEFINNFTIQFENLQYTVRALGANSNISDVKVQNQVSIDTRNSGGLIRPIMDASDITAIYSEDLSSYTTQGQAGDIARRGAFDNSSVWLSLGSGNSGTAFPTGTPSKPVDNIADAKAIADALGLKRITIFADDGSPVVFPATDIEGFDFQSTPPNQVFVQLAGQSYNHTTFNNMLVQASNPSLGVITLYGGVSAALNIDQAFFYEVDISSTIQFPAGSPYAVVIMNRCFSRSSVYGVIDCNNITSFIFMRQCAGVFTIKNSPAGSSINIGMTDGEIIIDSTCTGGTINISGTCIITDNSAGATVNDDTEYSFMKKKLLTVAKFIGLK